MVNLGLIWNKRRGTWPIEKARMFGMPCVGAAYTHPIKDKYRLTEGAKCMVCGAPAVHVHHEPNKGMGGKATLTLDGHELRPALIALCNRCHDMRHFSGGDKRLAIRWQWDNPEIHEYGWAIGALMNAGYAPHSKKLFELGYYAIYQGNKLVKKYREGTSNA